VRKSSRESCMVRVEKALAVAAGAEVGEGRPRHPPGVDPDVLPEVGVLHRHDRVAEHGRDVLEAHDHALLYGESPSRTRRPRRPGDDIGLEVLEGGDLGEVALEGEEDAEQGAPRIAAAKSAVTTARWMVRM